jgi:hypothetical protein
MNDGIRDKKLSTADFVAVADREREEERSESRMQTGTGIARVPEPSAEQSAPLFAADEGQRFRSQWTEIQTAFVDEPRKAVENADNLVAEAIQRLARIFADERAKLEHEWSRGDDKVSTEDLRIALRRYRSFFDRLLSV